MTIGGKAILITGANRGLGQALVEEALRRDAKRVYGGARQPLSHQDPRVTPLILDVTDETQIQQAVQKVDSVTPDIGRPFYRAVTTLDALALIEEPPSGAEGGSNSLRSGDGGN